MRPRLSLTCPAVLIGLLAGGLATALVGPAAAADTGVEPWLVHSSTVRLEPGVQILRDLEPLPGSSDLVALSWLYEAPASSPLVRLDATGRTVRWAATGEVAAIAGHNTRALAVTRDRIVMVGNAPTDQLDPTPGAYAAQRDPDAQDAAVFVAEVDPADGSLRWLSTLDGSGADFAKDIAIDADGNVWVVGDTQSADFPSTTGAFVRNQSWDRFVSVLSADGSTLEASRQIVGSDGAFALAGHVAALPGGGVVVASTLTEPPAEGVRTSQGREGGRGLTVMRMTLDGATPRITASRTLRTGGDHEDTALAVGPDGTIAVAGQTRHDGLLTIRGSQQPLPSWHLAATVTVMKPDLGEVVFSTYLGGAAASEQRVNGLAVDAWGAVWAAGQTSSTHFPVVEPLRTTALYDEAFVVRYARTGYRTRSTYLGGDDGDAASALAFGARGRPVVAGTTTSPDFPGAGGAGTPEGDYGDVFVTALEMNAPMGPIRGPRRTSDRTPTYDLSTQLAVARAQCRVDSRRWRWCNLRRPTTTVFTTPRLTPGLHTISARLLDRPGHAGPAKTIRVRITR